jgi:hypothetical protein
MKKKIEMIRSLTLFCIFSSHSFVAFSLLPFFSSAASPNSLSAVTIAISIPAIESAAEAQIFPIHSPSFHLFNPNLSSEIKYEPEKELHSYNGHHY